MLLGIITYRPIFDTFLNDANPENWESKKIESFVFSSKPGTEERQKINDTIQTQTTRFISSEGSSATALISYKIIDEKTASDKPVAVVFSNKHLSQNLYWKFIALVFLLILYVTMVYGPIAAFLVEMFPTKIRYTSMSLPYHIGNGVFGGLVPFIGLLLTTSFTKDPLVGLWYPIGIAALCFLIGTIYLTNKIHKDVTD
jgi:hypothetical protein